MIYRLVILGSLALSVTPAAAQPPPSGNPMVSINVGLGSYNISTGLYDGGQVNVSGSPCPSINVNVSIPVSGVKGPDEALAKAKDQIDRISIEIRDTAARCTDFRR